MVAVIIPQEQVREIHANVLLLIFPTGMTGKGASTGFSITHTHSCLARNFKGMEMQVFVLRMVFLN